MKICSPSHQALPCGMRLLCGENAKKKECEAEGSFDLRSRCTIRSAKEGARREHGNSNGCGGFF